MMEAAYINDYGSLDNVRIGEMRKPTIRPGYALIKMKAASVNPIDWKIVKGDLKPLFKAKFPLRLGSDGAGIIEGLGTDIIGFEVGDSVYFRCDKLETGTYAQYYLIPAGLMARIPANMSFTEAAAIPLAGLTAAQALSERAGLKVGDKVLIHAGAGGVGTFAIQYAKAMGALVATTASTKRFELLTELGADVLIDYHTQNVEDELSGYDIVLDSLGESVQEASFKTMKPGGTFVTLLGIPEPNVVSDMTKNPIIRLVSKLHHKKQKRRAGKYNLQFKHHWMRPDGAQLAEIAGLIEAGKIKAIIDSTFPLVQVGDAFARSMTGRAQGKIIITMD